MLDVFNQDAFNVVEMTKAINKQPFSPGRIGRMGLFEEDGVTSDMVAIEELDGKLSLVPTKERGDAPTQVSTDKRKVRPIKVPHLPVEDQIQASEVSGVREFGSNDQLQGVQRVVNRKLGKMARSLDATLEWHRIGAIKGKVLDANGGVLVDLFKEFNVAQRAEVGFDLKNNNPASGAVRKLINDVIRTIEDDLGAETYESIHCFCGSDFFDDLVAHKETKAAYERWNDGEFLRQRTARRAFFYAGVMFEEYRGKVGNTDFVESTKAHFFPVGVPDLFTTSFAPANFMETVNTVGLPRYSKQHVDEKYQRWVDVYSETNPLNLCTRPRVLIQGKNAA